MMQSVPGAVLETPVLHPVPSRNPVIVDELPETPVLIPDELDQARIKIRGRKKHAATPEDLERLDQSKDILKNVIEQHQERIRPEPGARALMAFCIPVPNSESVQASGSASGPERFDIATTPASARESGPNSRPKSRPTPEPNQKAEAKGKGKTEAKA